LEVQFSCVTRNKVKKRRKSIMDIPDLHAISIAKFICAKPGIRRLYTTKSKIMHENGREGI
jgi:predicted acylesterase/phospholipase RssA